MEKLKLYRREGLLWDNEYNDFGYVSFIPVCPQCKCKSINSSDPITLASIAFSKEFWCNCSLCDFKSCYSKNLLQMAEDLRVIVESEKYKTADIIDLDGVLTPVARVEQKDNDYRVDAKISINSKGKVQLMVLAGSKKDKNKTQLFVIPEDQKLGFDQNDNHPSEVFTKIEAEFKGSKSSIE